MSLAYIRPYIPKHIYYHTATDAHTYLIWQTSPEITLLLILFGYRPTQQCALSLSLLLYLPFSARYPFLLFHKTMHVYSTSATTTTSNSQHFTLQNRLLALPPSYRTTATYKHHTAKKPTTTASSNMMHQGESVH